MDVEKEIEDKWLDETGRLRVDLIEEDKCVDIINVPNKCMLKALEGIDGEMVQYISLINNKIPKIVGLDRFTQLLKLELRANHIMELENITHLQNLLELDLYENELEELPPAVLNFPRLTYLDLSFNHLRELPEDCLSGVPRLRELYFVQNKLSAIANVFGPVGNTLRTLELGANRIREIENLEPLRRLENLWLGKNKISTIQNLAPLTSLRVLSLQRNRLVEISTGLLPLTNLEELYLSENKITKIDNIHTLTKLRTLDLSMNEIPKIENLENLQELEELWLNSNKIEAMRDVELITKLPKLQTVYLEYNPLATDLQYRNKLVMLQPNLSQIDATPVIRKSERNVS